MSERPFGARQPGGPWDAIVIGSGMGGMGAAALMARAGLRVLILERHFEPGGFTHTFKRGGYRFDIGMHAMGEIGRHHPGGWLLHRLSGARLQWASMGDICERFLYPDREILIPNGRNVQIAHLQQHFPKEARGIEVWHRRVDRAGRGLERYFASRLLPPCLDRVAPLLTAPCWQYFGKTTQEVLEGLFDDEALMTALAARWVYYGAPPDLSSFGVTAVVTRHFYEGGFYPVGGGRALARALLEEVRSHGGWTRVRASVEEITVRSGRTTGVRLEGGEEIRAPVVLGALPLKGLLRLLPERSPWAEALDALPGTPAHLCLYLGFKGDPRRAGASGANVWLCAGYGHHRPTWQVSPTEPLPPPGVLYCSFPSLKDPSHDPGPEQRHTAVVITFVPWSAFAAWSGQAWRRRGDDYEAFKARLARALLERFLEAFPDLEPMLDFMELSTPLSTDHFMGTVDGSIYGLAPTPERYHCPLIRPRTWIRGLYLGGSDMASAGVMGAFLGGALGALAALGPRGVKGL